TTAYGSSRDSDRGATDSDRRNTTSAGTASSTANRGALSSTAGAKEEIQASLDSCCRVRGVAAWRRWSSGSIFLRGQALARREESCRHGKSHHTGRNKYQHKHEHEH